MALLSSLPLRSRFAGTLLFQRSAEQRLDYRLAADIEPRRLFIELP
jgi:hypothetical protein